MSPGFEGGGQHYCKHCNLDFAEWTQYRDHLAVMRARNDPKHIGCPKCGRDFKTERALQKHLVDFHPAPQKLQCPGCGKGPFSAVSAVLRHIEKRECPQITSEKLNKVGEEKTKFVRNLEAMTQRRVRNNFSDYINPGKEGYYKSDIWGSDDTGTAPPALDARGVAEVEKLARDGVLCVDRQMQPVSGLEQLHEVASRSANRVSSSTGSNAKKTATPTSWEDTTSGLVQFLHRSDVTSEATGTGAGFRAKDNVVDWSIEDSQTSQPDTEAPTLLGGTHVREWLFESTNSTGGKQSATEMPAATKVKRWIAGLSVEEDTPATGLSSAFSGATDWSVNSMTSTSERRLPGTAVVVDWSTAPTSEKQLPGSGGVVDWSTTPRITYATIASSAAPTAGNGNASGPGDPQSLGTVDAQMVHPGNDSTTGAEETPGIWSADPTVASTRWPTSEEMATIRGVDLDTTFDEKHPSHPDNPLFKVETCKTIFGGYKCPLPFCLKTFKGSRGLVQHLRGPTHGKEKILCPRCHKLFRTRASALAHTEAENSRCRARDYANYDAYMDQVTSGLINVDLARNKDGSRRYVVPDSAWEMFGGTKGAVKASKQPESQSVNFW